jgi:hypothetical protein
MTSRFVQPRIVEPGADQTLTMPVSIDFHLERPDQKPSLQNGLIDICGMSFGGSAVRASYLGYYDIHDGIPWPEFWIAFMRSASSSENHPMMG